MPYALFSNSVRVSRIFSKKSDVWEHAAQNGLVLEIGSGEEDPPRRLLDMGYAIRECAGDHPVTGGISDRTMPQIIAACAVNQPSAIAAS